MHSYMEFWHVITFRRNGFTCYMYPSCNVLHFHFFIYLFISFYFLLFSSFYLYSTVIRVEFVINNMEKIQNIWKYALNIYNCKLIFLKIFSKGICICRGQSRTYPFLIFWFLEYDFTVSCTCSKKNPWRAFSGMARYTLTIFC